MDDMYTIEGLKRAQEDLKRWQDAAAGTTSNNPDRFKGHINSARSIVRRITRVLKQNGTLPRTPQEQLDSELDAKFPKARSKDIVEYNGQRYQLRFTPAIRSRSRKTVKEWDHTWKLLNDSD
jgi:hypothetical protein